jgi:NADH-quinone oxidoreductase subunit L
MLTTLSVLIVLLPLAGTAVAGALGSRWLKGATHWPVIAGVGGAAVAAILLLSNVAGGPAAEEPFRPVLYQWFAAGAAQWFNVEFWIDPLTAVMLATVTFIATLVVIYSREYMRHHDHPERGYERYFAFLGLFVFSMAMLVLGGNFLLLYLGWELVGLCSYLLIGFYYEKPSAAAAAKKAFIVNRIGDFGFGLGVILILLTFGHADYHTVFAAAKAAVAHDVESLAAVLNLSTEAAAARLEVIEGRLPIIALLLFCGAIGKSAQFPLYVWLPDAMEGPSPVSALIHAATMVTAGVYMTVRCGVIFAASPTVLLIVAIVGGGTALFAATIALVQTDMKRILAYSTVSQLGYMFLGVGCAAASSAIFHLFTHAFFKALLFLGAGSVMHAMGGIIDVRRFSGLRRILPVTCVTMVLGAAALAGFPLLSGFWSKDEIIHHAFEAHPILGILGFVTAALTAFYTFRMIFLAFWGNERVPEGVEAHESGPWILVPLVVLAIGAVFAGFFGVHVEGGGFLGFLEPGGALHRFLEPVVQPFAAAHGHAAAGHAPEVAEEAHGVLAAIAHHWPMYLSSLIAIGGIVVAYVFYVSRPWIPHVLRTTYAQAHLTLRHKYYVDEAYDAAFVRPLWESGRVFFRIDEFVIDGLLWVITAIPRLIGYVFRGLQQGAMQGYGLSMAAGLAIIIILALWGS